jgi:hypothetical protein
VEEGLIVLEPPDVLTLVCNIGIFKLSGAIISHLKKPKTLGSI